MLPIVQELKDTFKPPYQMKDLFSIFISLFVMITIPLTVIQVSNQRDPRSSAATVESSSSSELQVTIDAPTVNQTVSGTVDIVISANDSSAGINSVGISSNGKVLANINNVRSTPKFSTKFSWDTTKERNGLQSLIASTTNSNGKTSRSKPLKVTVTNDDSEDPGVSFSNLEDGAYLSESYQIKIAASDNVGVSSVRLEIDNTLVKTFTKLPYTYTWDLSSIAAGIHKLKATAIDFNGNKSTSEIQIYKGVKGLKN